MAWKIEEGEFEDVNLEGLQVVVVIRSEKTLGFQGIRKAGEVRSVIYLDEQASESQQKALLNFAKKHIGAAAQEIARVEVTPISMKLDVVSLRGELAAGKAVELKTRKAGRGDCICSNEAAYYPPLAEVENFAPGVTLEGRFSGRGLGTRWSTPGDRSSYMGTFAY